MSNTWGGIGQNEFFVFTVQNFKGRFHCTTFKPMELYDTFSLLHWQSNIRKGLHATCKLRYAKKSRFLERNFSLKATVTDILIVNVVNSKDY
jgi:hypothetical protein